MTTPARQGNLTFVTTAIARAGQTAVIGGDQAVTYRVLLARSSAAAYALLDGRSDLA